MLTRSRIVIVLVGILMLAMLAQTAYASARPDGEPIKVKIIIEKNSAWDTGSGKQLIGEEVNEARRIWFANAGVKLHIPGAYNVVEGDPASDITKAEIEKYAQAHGAEAKEILVIFRDKSVGVSRAWTEPTLVDKDKPVIIVGKQVLDKPGTKRDLAHELGHVLLRSEGHTTGTNDLMNITWAPNNGDKVSPEDTEKAKKYPAKLSHQ